MYRLGGEAEHPRPLSCLLAYKKLVSFEKRQKPQHKVEKMHVSCVLEGKTAIRYTHNVSTNGPQKVALKAHTRRGPLSGPVMGPVGASRNTWAGHTKKRQGNLLFMWAGP